MEFIPFNSFEEAHAAMRRATDAANAGLTDAQKALRDDTENERYWIQFTSYGFEVYGHLWSDKTVRERTSATYAKYPDEQEYMEDEIASTQASRKDGYMFGEAWSAPYPEGELGSTHVSQVQPISKEMFENARTNGWKMT